MITEFKEGELYKHKRMHDTAVLILWSKDKDEDQLELFVKWYNTKYKHFIDDEIITVKKSELSNWIFLEKQ